MRCVQSNNHCMARLFAEMCIISPLFVVLPLWVVDPKSSYSLGNALFHVRMLSQHILLRVRFQPEGYHFLVIYELPVPGYVSNKQDLARLDCLIITVSELLWCAFEQVEKPRCRSVEAKKADDEKVCERRYEILRYAPGYSRISFIFYEV